MANSCSLNFKKGENKITDGYTDEVAEKFAEERKVNARPKETVVEIDHRGAFQRQKNRFTTPIGFGEGEAKPESGKYVLYWAKLCHWSNRASIVRELLGLEDAIDVHIVTFTGETNKYGWGFREDKDFADPILGAHFLSEYYLNADPNYSGRCTVPAFVDKTTKKVVNNDYHRLTNYLEANFKEFQKNDIDLYPEELREEIDILNDWLFPNINNAHYRMAFCQSLLAYNEAYDDFFNAMDKLEERLEYKRFLFGDYVTDSDVRFYVTLARWDSYYYTSLGPQKKRMMEYKNIWAYARDLYEIPAFKNNTYFRDFCKSRENKSYLGRFNKDIPYDEIWSTPQTRRFLSKTPDEKFLHRK